jgi:FixJ family two-component response regulator
VNQSVSHGLVLILDDDRSVGSAYYRVLSESGFYARVFESFSELKRYFANEFDSTRPACLLLDMRMSEVSGLEVQEWLKLHQLSLPVVFVSGESEVAEAVEAMRHGAVDFLVKPVDVEQLLQGVRKAFSQYVAPNRPTSSDAFKTLSEREWEVLALVIKGFRSQQIAQELDITLRTVKLHRGNIMRKVGATNAAHLVTLYHGRPSS